MTSQAESSVDYRFTLANERTFLAWQRTALGLSAATVALSQLVPRHAVHGMQYLLAAMSGVLAIASASAGLVRWRRVDRAMRCAEDLPHHRMPAVLASGLVLLGLCVSALLVVDAANG